MVEICFYWKQDEIEIGAHKEQNEMSREFASNPAL